MKHYLTALAAASMLLGSCAKPVGSDIAMTDDSLIAFHAEGEGLNTTVATKATAVTSLSSFKVVATSGAAGSESLAWGPIDFSGTPYVGGKYWPSTDPSYHFYASNAAVAFAAAGCTVSPSDASTDVVAAYLATPTYKASNTLTFNHIYSRIGTISVAAPSGYSISGVSLALSAPVGGTYNLRTGTWTPAAAAAQTIVTGSNDVYVVPGTYKLTVSYTLTKGDYVESFTKSADVSLVMGKINNISTTAPEGSATQIQFTISITPWGENNITPVLS